MSNETTRQILKSIVEQPVIPKTSLIADIWNILELKNVEIKEKFGDDTFHLYVNHEQNDNIYRSIYKYYDDFYKINYLKF